MPSNGLRSALETAMLEAKMGHTLVLKVLDHFGFESIGRTTVNEKEVRLYRDPSGDFTFGLVEDFVVPGRDSLACAGVVQLGERSTYLILIPSPSDSLMSDLVEIALSHTESSSHALLGLLRNLSPDNRQEIIGHEMTHIDDQRFSRWGQVAFMSQLLDSGLTRINLSKEMAARILPTVPSEAENHVATLLMELKAFCSNIKTDPGRSSVANACCSEIESALSAAGGSEAVLADQLRTWQRCISGPGSSYKTGGDEAVAIAIKWLKQEGTLYPERRARE